MAEVRRIWRDTTKVASWESPIYAEWLAAIRAVNGGLPRSRRLRVLAITPESGRRRASLYRAPCGLPTGIAADGQSGGRIHERSRQAVDDQVG